MKLHKPKSIQEAIDDLQQFLEADLYSKFRPEQEIAGETLYREDIFPNEKEFLKYISEHFNILRKQINKLKTQKEQKENKQWRY